MGVAEYTISEYLEAIQRDKANMREYQKLRGPPVFVGVQNLNYHVTLVPPFRAAPSDGWFKKTWTWLAGVVQFQMGIPINKIHRVYISLLHNNQKQDQFINSFDFIFQIPMQPLKDCTFYFKAGEMTLVLGAPGSGQDALFKILTNKMRNGKATGTIHYNGKKIRKKDFHQITSYIGKNDVGIHVRKYLQPSPSPTLRYFS